MSIGVLAKMLKRYRSEIIAFAILVIVLATFVAMWQCTNTVFRVFKSGF